MTTTASPLKILFVDDDPLILQGLKRMLRPMREQWAMSFVESGAKALELLAESPFQVVVSDMRMPGMDGAQLLTEIRNRHPKTVRLILSGHADNDLIMRCVGTAHQFLAKPCEPEAIQMAISRASTFDSSMKSERVKQIIVQMDSIPTVPSVYSEIVEKLRDEAALIDEVSAILVKDPAMTAKLLKLVNSAFFGLCREVSSPSEAVAYLGIETIKALVLSVNAFGCFDASKIRGFALEALWGHSLEVAAAAKRIIEMESVPKSFADESFVAGMLHDIGKLVLAINLPEEFEQALGRQEKEQIPLHVAEEQIFGANHADVAGYIFSLWGLPARVVEAITFHHDPKISACNALNPLIAVHVADCVVHQRREPSERAQTIYRPQMEFLESVGLSGNITNWMNLEL